MSSMYRPDPDHPYVDTTELQLCGVTFGFDIVGPSQKFDEATGRTGVLDCTMLLQLQLESEKIIKSKWLDFTHFSTKCNFFGLYWCENANI